MYTRIATAAGVAAAVFIAALPPHASGQESVPPAAQERQQGAEIVLPPQLETEKPATLAVLDRDGRLVAGVTVGLPDGRKVTTDSSGRARFVVTSTPGPFVAEISSAQSPNAAQAAHVQAAAIVIPHPTEIQSGSPAKVVVTNYPRAVALDDHIVVRGSGFRGDADANHVTLAGSAVLVLASSPEALVLQPGSAAAIPGLTDVVIEVAGRRSGPLAIALVSLEITLPARELAVGKKDNLIVHVNGTTQKVTLAVENLSREEIGLVNGNFQRVISSGGPENMAFTPLRALRAGGFSVSVRVMTAAPDAGILALVRRELVAASGLAAGDWVRAIDRALERLDQAGPDFRGVPRLVDEIEKMLSGDPPGEVGKHLQAAWLELVRD
jgi:hypothetical protein